MRGGHKGMEERDLGLRKWLLVDCLMSSLWVVLGSLGLGWSWVVLGDQPNLILDFRDCRGFMLCTF